MLPLSAMWKKQRGKSRMAKSKISREERMSEIQDKLLAGIKQIYESGKWAEYIAVMSKFPSYSINNCILIASQCPQVS